MERDEALASSRLLFVSVGLGFHGPLCVEMRPGLIALAFPTGFQRTLTPYGGKVDGSRSINQEETASSGGGGECWTI